MTDEPTLSPESDRLISDARVAAYHFGSRGWTYCTAADEAAFALRRHIAALEADVSHVNARDKRIAQLLLRIESLEADTLTPEEARAVLSRGKWAGKIRAGVLAGVPAFFGQNLNSGLAKLEIRASESHPLPEIPSHD